MRDKLNYKNYLQLDKMLNTQKPLTDKHDEMLFIIIHQISELWMKLTLHELQTTLKTIQHDELKTIFKILNQITHLQKQLTHT